MGSCRAPPGTRAGLLVHPNADLTLSQPSMEEKGHGWVLEAAELRSFVEQWMPDPEHRCDPEVSPRHAPLVALPVTVIATAEHDPLRDEGDALGHLSAAAAQAGRALFSQFGHLLT